MVGAAQGEIAALDDPHNARWEIPAGRMKARRPHVVPLLPMARQLFLEAIARRRTQDDKSGIFASRFLARNTLARHSLSQALRRVIRSLKVKGPAAAAVRSLKDNPPTPHDFRRTVATGLAELQIPREDRLAVLAHQPSDVHGAVYDKYERLREKRIALAAWERHLSWVLRQEANATVVPMQRGRS
jgi:integrase